MRSLLILLLSGAIAPLHAFELQPLWTTTGLRNPESVIAATDGASLFVSNVDGEADARDGRGGISRLSLDGTVMAAD